MSTKLFRCGRNNSQPLRNSGKMGWVTGVLWVWQLYLEKGIAASEFFHHLLWGTNFMPSFSHVLWQLHQIVFIFPPCYCSTLNSYHSWTVCGTTSLGEKDGRLKIGTEHTWTQFQRELGIVNITLTLQRSAALSNSPVEPRSTDEYCYQLESSLNMRKGSWESSEQDAWTTHPTCQQQHP